MGLVPEVPEPAPQLFLKFPKDIANDLRGDRRIVFRSDLAEILRLDRVSA